jgi:hypothetical protein
MKWNFGILMLLCISTAAFSQNANQAFYNKLKFGVVFGLTQPIVTNGFNVEVNYYTDKFVFDYSHGFNLHFKNKLVTGENAKQQLKFKVSHSLGIGIGYRITPSFNIRLEPKLHLWQVYYANQAYSKNNILKKYATYTLGAGAYYLWAPFSKSASDLKRVIVVPSFRWWPNIKTSLPNNSWQYNNIVTNKTEIHRANKIGVANSPFFGNVSIGYGF